MLLFFLVLLGGCGFRPYRLGKAFAGRNQVLGKNFSQGPRLIEVSFDPGGPEVGERDPKDPPPYQDYQMGIDPRNGRLKPPRLFSQSSILIALAPGIDPSSVRLRLFIKSDPFLEKDLTEVRTLVGEVEDSYANEVVFIDDIFPRLHRQLVLYPDDLSGPYQGTYMRAHDLLLIEVEDLATGAKQKVLFEYVPTGIRVDFGAHLLLSSGLDLLDIGVTQLGEIRQPKKTPRLRGGRAPRRGVEIPADVGQVDPQALDLAFMLTATFGYRGTAERGTRRWFGDHFTLVIDLGVGNVGAVTEFIDPDTDDRIQLLQNQFLVGFGVQFFDFLSVHLINNLFADFPINGADDVDVEAVLIPAFGLDVGTAIRFSRRLYERLFRSTRLKSFGEGDPPPRAFTTSSLPINPILPPGKKAPKGRPSLKEPAPLDETVALPEDLSL